MTEDVVPPGFDRAFAEWWMKDGPVDDLGEAAPIDDRHGYKIVVLA